MLVGYFLGEDKSPKYRGFNFYNLKVFADQCFETPYRPVVDVFGSVSKIADVFKSGKVANSPPRFVRDTC